MLKQTNPIDPYAKFRRDTLRYVAVFEIKNFNDIVINYPKEAFTILVEVEESLKEILEKKVKYKFEEVALNQNIIIKVMNEKLIIFTKSNTNLDLISILTIASKIMSYSVSKHILMTGYLTYGHFYFNNENNIFCGKPLVIAEQMLNSIKSCCVVCDNLVNQNVSEARVFLNDPNFFSKLEKSLIEPYEVPIYGTKINGGLVKKKMFIIDWPRAEIDIFETIKQYTLKEFYTPYEKIYGPYSKLDHFKQTCFEETLKSLNYSLSKCIKMFNSLI